MDVTEKLRRDDYALTMTERVLAADLIESLRSDVESGKDRAEVAERALADADRVIAEAICFPSAGLPDHRIRWLQDKINLSRACAFLDKLEVDNG